MPGKIFLYAPTPVTSASIISALGYTPADVAGSTGNFIVTGTTQTGSSANSFVSITGIWNTTGTPTADLVNVTDTASNAASLLMDRQIGGVSKFNVKKDGTVFATKLTVGSSTFATNSGLINIQYNSNSTTEPGAINIHTGTGSQPELILGVDNSKQWAYLQAASRDVSFSTYPLVLNPNGATICLGGGGVATNATTGFMTMASCAGTPTGVPASVPSNQVAWVFDRTNNKIYVYNGAWKGSAALT